jgi:site-specific DNA-cytosine methylase
MPDSFVVIENTPGYMPEDCDPGIFDNYADAVAHANALCDELEEAGYTVDRSLASSGNYFAAHATRADTVAPDLGRYVAVERDES